MAPFPLPLNATFPDFSYHYSDFGIHHIHRWCRLLLWFNIIVASPLDMERRPSRLIGTNCDASDSKYFDAIRF